MLKRRNTTMLGSTTMSLYTEHLDRLKKNIKDDFTEWSKNLEFARHEEPVVRPGRKFDRIFRGSSIWGFVAKKDGSHKGIPFRMGDVFKAQGLHQPAKHVRGSIFDNNTDWFTWTGPEYMFRKTLRMAQDESKVVSS
jgi:hypothetical protein